MLDLLRADYTFVNERVARHYGIPGRLRQPLPPRDAAESRLSAAACSRTDRSWRRRRIPERTSPVLRGKYLLDNIFGLPVPPPPPGVDTTLPDAKPGATPPTIRERLPQHRNNAVCSSCHSAIDPPGFALEQFDAIGGWRTVDEAGRPVDAVGTTGQWPDARRPVGPARVLLEKPDRFPQTVTEKLLAYAIGRRLEYYDRPAVRQIVRDAAANDFRWSSLVLGIAKSPAFQMRAVAGVTMSFVTTKSLPRRTILRGLGATLALPFLDAMVPAFAPRARAAAKPAHRFLTFYVPNGMAMEYWTPKGEGARVRAVADPRAAGAVPRPDAGAVAG